MGFGQCRIVLDSPNFTYYAGQTVFGKLECNLDKVKDFRGIYVKAEGAANVHWTTDHTRKVNDRSVQYKKYHNAKEEYFSLKQYLVGSEHGKGEKKLNAGRHVYPFQIHIPAHCPSSFEGKYGNIRYSIRAVVDRALKADDEVNVDVRVVARVDLNEDPTSKKPMHFEFSETYCCWCMSSGVAECAVKLPASGYCPGQIIPVEVSCNNHSSVDIHNIKLILKKFIKYHAHHEPGTKNEETVIAEIKRGPIKGNTNKSWLVEMEVPVIDTCNVDSCRIIDIVYKFKVKINPEGCHSSSSDSKIIKLGTTPVTGTENQGPDPLDTPMPQPVMAIEANTIPAFNQSYPGANQPYSGAQTAYPSGPGHNPPYPGAAGASPPYPGAPGAGPPYPGAPGAGSPYLGAPGTGSPYPGAPAASPPYPGANQPYPSANLPYPTTSSYPYPAANPPVYQPGFGFKTNMEYQNAGPVGMPMPSPPQQPAPWNQVTPSAPVPSTPINEYPESKPLMTDGDSSPYNPAFMGKQ